MTDQDLTFAALGRRQPGIRSACPICGQATAGTVQIVLSGRKGGKPKLVTSASKTLCERHAVELFKRLEATRAEFLGESA